MGDCLVGLVSPPGLWSIVYSCAGWGGITGSAVSRSRSNVGEAHTGVMGQTRFPVHAECIGVGLRFCCFFVGSEALWGSLSPRLALGRSGSGAASLLMWLSC